MSKKPENNEKTHVSRMTIQTNDPRTNKVLGSVNGLGMLAKTFNDSDNPQKSVSTPNQAPTAKQGGQSNDKK